MQGSSEGWVEVEIDITGGDSESQLASCTAKAMAYCGHSMVVSLLKLRCGMPGSEAVAMHLHHALHGSPAGSNSMEYFAVCRLMLQTALFLGLKVLGCTCAGDGAQARSGGSPHSRAERSQSSSAQGAIPHQRRRPGSSAGTSRLRQQVRPDVCELLLPVTCSALVSASASRCKDVLSVPGPNGLGATGGYGISMQWCAFPVALRPNQA